MNAKTTLLAVVILAALVSSAIAQEQTSTNYGNTVVSVGSGGGYNMSGTSYDCTIGVAGEDAASTDRELSSTNYQCSVGGVFTIWYLGTSWNTWISSFSSGSSWTDASNWSYGVPSGQDVYIRPAISYPTIDGAASVANLYILAGATIDFSGTPTLTVSGSLEVAGEFDLGSGTLDLTGDLVNTGTATVTSGVIQLTGASDSDITGVTSLGSLTVNKSTYTNTVTPDGSLTISGSLTIAEGTLQMHDGSAFDLTLSTTGTHEVQDGGILDMSSGTNAITRQGGSGDFTLTVNGGTAKLTDFTFQYGVLDLDGDAYLPAFSNGTFSNQGSDNFYINTEGLTSGVFADNMSFSGTVGSDFNVKASNGSGHIYVTNSTGTISGEIHDIDNYNRVHWPLYDLRIIENSTIHRNMSLQEVLDTYGTAGDVFSSYDGIIYAGDVDWTANVTIENATIAGDITGGNTGTLRNCVIIGSIDDVDKVYNCTVYGNVGSSTNCNEVRNCVVMGSLSADASSNNVTGTYAGLKGNFVDPDNYDFHLKSTASSMIDAGGSIGVTTDLDGHDRDGSPDIGADEYMAAAKSLFTIDTTSGGLAGQITDMVVYATSWTGQHNLYVATNYINSAGADVYQIRVYDTATLSNTPKLTANASSFITDIVWCKVSATQLAIGALEDSDLDGEADTFEMFEHNFSGGTLNLRSSPSYSVSGPLGSVGMVFQSPNRYFTFVEGGTGSTNGRLHKVLINVAGTLSLGAHTTGPTTYNLSEDCSPALTYGSTGYIFLGANDSLSGGADADCVKLGFDLSYPTPAAYDTAATFNAQDIYLDYGQGRILIAPEGSTVHRIDPSNMSADYSKAITISGASAPFQNSSYISSYYGDTYYYGIVMDNDGYQYLYKMAGSNGSITGDSDWPFEMRGAFIGNMFVTADRVCFGTDAGCIYAIEKENDSDAGDDGTSSANGLNEPAYRLFGQYVTGAAAEYSTSPGKHFYATNEGRIIVQEVP